MQTICSVWDEGNHLTTAADQSWDSGVRNRGAMFSRPFPMAGTFPYYCFVHGGQRGREVEQSERPLTQGHTEKHHVALRLATGREGEASVPTPARKERTMKWAICFGGTVLLVLTLQQVNLDVITLNGMPCGLEGKPGGSPSQKDLDRQKNRYAMPSASDIDPEVSLAAMLAPGKDIKRFDATKAARIRGFVIDVKVGGKESCNCEAADPAERDTHIELGLADRVDERQRVIVEVTPRLRILRRKAGEDWTTDALREKYQKQWVEVTGWLTFDTAHIKQAENTNPGNEGNWRATCWEIHPVTNITLVDGPPAEAKDFQPDSLRALQSLHAAHLTRIPGGKAALGKFHEAVLEKFSPEERKEAEEEARARKLAPK